MSTLPLVSHGHVGDNWKTAEFTTADMVVCQSWVHPECTLKEGSQWSVIATTHEEESVMEEGGVQEGKEGTIASYGGVPTLTAMCPVHKKTPTYCICKKIDDGSDDFLECDSCCDWFHYKCEGVDPDNPPSKFTCRQCQKRNGKVPESERLENSAKMAFYDSELVGQGILKVGCWLGEVLRSLQLPSGGVIAARKAGQQQSTTIKTEPVKGEEGAMAFQSLCNHISRGKYLMKGEQYVQNIGTEGYGAQDDEASDNLSIPVFLEHRVNRTLSELEKARHDIVAWQNDVESWKNAHSEPYMKSGKTKRGTWNVMNEDLEREIEELEGFLARSSSLLCLPVDLEFVKGSRDISVWILKVRILLNEEEGTGGSGIDGHHVNEMEGRTKQQLPRASELHKLILEGQDLRAGSFSRATGAWRHVSNLSSVAQAWTKKAEAMLTNLKTNGVSLRLDTIETQLRTGLTMGFAFPECQMLLEVVESWSRWSKRVKLLMSEFVPSGKSLFHITRNKVQEMKSEFQSFILSATALLNEINASDYSLKSPTRDELIQSIRRIYWVNEAKAALDSAERVGFARRKTLSDGARAVEMADQRPSSSGFSALIDTSLHLRDETFDNKFSDEEEDGHQTATTATATAAGGREQEKKGRGIFEEVKDAAEGGPVVLLAKELLAKMEKTSSANTTRRPLFPTEEAGFPSEPELVLASLQRHDIHYLEEDLIAYFKELIYWEQEVTGVMVEPSILPNIAKLKGIRKVGYTLVRQFLQLGKKKSPSKRNITSMASGQSPATPPTFIQEALNDLNEKIALTEKWEASALDIVLRIRAHDKPLCELSKPLHEAINAGKRLRVSVVQRLKQLQSLAAGVREKEWEMTAQSILSHQLFMKPLALHPSEATQRLIMLNGLLQGGYEVLAHPVLMNIVRFLFSSEKPLSPPHEKEQVAAAADSSNDGDPPEDTLLSLISEGESMVDLDICYSDSGSAAATFIAASTAVKERLVYLHGRVWSAKATTLISPIGDDAESRGRHMPALLSVAKQHISRFSDLFTGLESFENKRLVLQYEVMKAEKVDSAFAETVHSACHPRNLLATNSHSAEAETDTSLNEIEGGLKLQKSLEKAEKALALVKTASSEAGLILQTEAEKRASTYVSAISVCTEAMSLGARALRLPLDRLCAMDGVKLRRALADDGVVASDYFLLDNALSKAENISVLASSWRDRVLTLLTPKIPDMPSRETAEAIAQVILGRSVEETGEVRTCSTPPKFVTLDMLRSEMDAYVVSLLTSNDDFLMHLRATVNHVSEWETKALDMAGLVCDTRSKLSIITEFLQNGRGLPARLPCWSIVHWVYLVLKAHHALEEYKMSYNDRKIPLTIAQDFVSTYTDLVTVVEQSSAPEGETEDDNVFPFLASRAAKYLMPTAATRSTCHPLHRLCESSITTLMEFSANVERANEERSHTRALFSDIFEAGQLTGGLRLNRSKHVLLKVNSETLGATLFNLRDLPDVTIIDDLTNALYQALKYLDPLHAELNYAPGNAAAIVDIEAERQRLGQGPQHLKSYHPKMEGDKVDLYSTKPLVVASQGGSATVPKSRQRKFKDPILSQLKICSKCHIGKKGRVSCRVIQQHWEDPDWPALPNSEKWTPPKGFMEWFEAHKRDSPLFKHGGDKLLPPTITQTLSTTSPRQAPPCSSQYESMASKVLPCVRSDCTSIVARTGSVFCSSLCEVRSGEESLNALLGLKCLEATKWMMINQGHISESLSETAVAHISSKVDKVLRRAACSNESGSALGAGGNGKRKLNTMDNGSMDICLTAEDSATTGLSKSKSAVEGGRSLISDRTPFGHVGCDHALDRLSKISGDGAMKGRRKVMTRFESLFLSGMLYMGLVPDPAFCHTLAWDLENELHELFPLKTHAKQYKDKRSSLLFNLQASKNPKLFKEVLLGMDLGKLCKMSATEMAPSDRQQEMRRLREEAVGQHWIRDTGQEDDVVWNSEQGALLHKSQIGRENTILISSNSDLSCSVSMPTTAPLKSSASHKRNSVEPMDEESKGGGYSPSLKKRKESISSDSHQHIDLQGLESMEDYSSSLDEVLIPNNVGGGMLGSETNERVGDESVSAGPFQASSAKAAPVPVLGFSDSQSSAKEKKTGSTSLDEELVPPPDEEDEGGFSPIKVVEVQEKQKYNQWGDLYPGMVELKPDDASEGRSVRFLINDPTSKTRFYVRVLAKANLSSEINPILRHTWEVRGRATSQQALDLLSRSTSEGKKKATLAIIPVEVCTCVMLHSLSFPYLVLLFSLYYFSLACDDYFHRKTQMMQESYLGTLFTNMTDT